MKVSFLGFAMSEVLVFLYKYAVYKNQGNYKSIPEKWLNEAEKLIPTEEDFKNVENFIFNTIDLGEGSRELNVQLNKRSSEFDSEEYDKLHGKSQAYIAIEELGYLVKNFYRSNLDDDSGRSRMKIIVCGINKKTMQDNQFLSGAASNVGASANSANSSSDSSTMVTPSNKGVMVASATASTTVSTTLQTAPAPGAPSTKEKEKVSFNGLEMAQVLAYLYKYAVYKNKENYKPIVQERWVSEARRLIRDNGFTFKSIDLGGGPRELNVQFNVIYNDFDSEEYDKLHGEKQAYTAINELKELVEILRRSSKNRLIGSATPRMDIVLYGGNKKTMNDNQFLSGAAANVGTSSNSTNSSSNSSTAVTFSNKGSMAASPTALTTVSTTSQKTAPAPGASSVKEKEKIDKQDSACYIQ